MAVPTDNGAWIRRFHPAPDAPTRLVCFAHAGGSASYFYPVSQALSPGLDVLAVQYPGRQDRRAEPAFEDVPRLVDALVDEVAVWADRPLALFGHSLGATVAFEVARRLQARGTEVSALFASGRRAPSRHRPAWVHEGDDDALISEMLKLEGTDAQMLTDPELVRMVLPALRADYRAAETYRYQPGPPLTCPVYALTGDADPQVDVPDAESWRGHTTGPFALHVFSGGHFYLNRHAPQVLALIRRHAADGVVAGHARA
ncbi:Surfactin synthase thioesterase subunit [Micromonospora purpureochromogenes]|uniref:Surfactin synthase thioesterase subunit n=1 Tax=Micromonospora purpureochromogenes TaxID=47872 RepID=A0A1C4ZN19_9ACTN|nr:alpha/beta fold hydrolase [Micromonospora purpureochromogenes]SCF34325.1 Surfactin synthase thioesterase subunit [Micromonospora purpureochromogenes]